jgi:hypothetical protein
MVGERFEGSSIYALTLGGVVVKLKWASVKIESSKENYSRHEVGAHVADFNFKNCVFVENSR